MRPVKSGKKFAGRFIPALIFSLIIPAAIFGATYTWNSVIVGGGGFVDGIIYHPTVSGLCYARTDMGGAYRWDSGTSQWVSITDMMNRNNSDYMGILSIAVDPNDATRVYMECGKYTASWAGTGAVLSSTNQGASWTINALTVKIGGNEDGRGAGERLVVDPNLGSILFMGTTANGLWKSTNYGAAWAQVAAFTPTNVNFVIFDKSSGTTGNATQRIFAGVNSTAGQTLYVSINGGTSWSVVAGQPNGVMALRADIAGGNLFMTFSNVVGPNNATAGSVWKYTISSGTWTNITPPTVTGQTYGFGGISVDAQNNSNIILSTLDLWWLHDQVWYSTNGGTSWTELLFTSSSFTEKATWNRTYAPWTSGRSPHWLADIKIDPFNTGHAMFGTGYGIWACDNVAAATTTWYFKDNVLEETVPMQIVSPPSGTLLLSAMGDQGGFRHDNVGVSPPGGFFMPDVGSTLSIDFAATTPAKIVKAYTASPYGAYSTDSGTTWTNFAASPGGTSAGGSKTIAVSANGNNIVWGPTGAALSYSTNNGGLWTGCGGGFTPTSGGYFSIASDRVNSTKFYLYDMINGLLWYSANGGQTFTQSATAYPVLPTYNAGDGTVAAVFGIEGDVWITTGAGGLWHSTNSGQTGAKISAVTEAYLVGFGKALNAYPSVYIWGIVGGTLGIFRSDDTGATWTRINDDNHQFGWLHSITGDQRTYGRCYVSTEGRGILYGDVAAAGTPTYTPQNSPTFTRTMTGTYTRTPTPVMTGTFTITPTFTRSITQTFTGTQTRTATATYTSTPANTVSYTVTATLTRTATATYTATPANSYTYTATFTRSATPTCTNTATYTTTVTSTFTRTATATGTYTPVNTATFTATGTPSPTRTGTPTGTNTQASTSTYTETGTATATATPSATNTRTQSATASASPTGTYSATASMSPSGTITNTQTWTRTQTATSTRTATPTYTVTPTFTVTTQNTPTITPTVTLSYTVTATGTPANTTSATASVSPSVSFTNTSTRTYTPTVTSTRTATGTGTDTPTFTITTQNTPTITPTVTPSYTVTATGTPANTASATASVSPSVSFTNTSTRTYSASATASMSPTYTVTITRTWSATASVSPTSTKTQTQTQTQTASVSPSNTYTGTPTPTVTYTRTATGTGTDTPTFTITTQNTPTVTPTSSATASVSQTITYSATASMSPTRTVTNTQTWTETQTSSVSDTATNTVTRTNTATFTATDTRTPTLTDTATFTQTLTLTVTASASPTPSRTETATGSQTPTSTESPDYSPTETPTGTPPTTTDTPTVTETDTELPTDTPSGTGTNTATYTRTETGTVTMTVTFTNTEQPTSTTTPTETGTAVSTGTNTPVNTATRTNTPVPTSTNTPVSTLTITRTNTPTSTRTATATFTFTMTVPAATATLTITLESGTLTVDNVLIYPNPYDPLKGNLMFRFDAAGTADKITVRIYTVSFRRIISETVGGTYTGISNVSLAAYKLSKLANGAYYAVLEAEAGGQRAVSKPVELIILK